MSTAERRVQQFTPAPDWTWPGGTGGQTAYQLDVSRQELEERLGIEYTDPDGQWGDQPGPMMHAFVDIDGTPVRLIEYIVGEDEYLSGITEIDLDPESPITEQVLIDALQLTPEQVVWRAES